MHKCQTTQQDIIYLCYIKTLNKIGRQCSHFVFGFFRMDAAPPASSSSSSSATVPPGIPHGCMFELHSILEEWIAEDATCVLSLTSRKWTASLIKIYCDQRSVAGVTALLSNLEEKRQSKRFKSGSLQLNYTEKQV